MTAPVLASLPPRSRGADLSAEADHGDCPRLSDGKSFRITARRPADPGGSCAVVVISDGWDTGDPAVLQHEMQRLSRVAHRIIWVNPRTQHPEYQPLAGGMAAAWPFCDAIVSGHSLHALDDLTEALSHPGRHRAAPGTATRAAAGSAP